MTIGRGDNRWNTSESPSLSLMEPLFSSLESIGDGRCMSVPERAREERTGRFPALRSAPGRLMEPIPEHLTGTRCFFAPCSVGLPI